MQVTVIEKNEAKRILILEAAVRKQTGETVMTGRSALKEMVLVARGAA